MPFLKPEKHYADLYDLFTVKGGLRRQKLCIPEDETIKSRWGAKVGEIGMILWKGERYSCKSETIMKWMELDRQRDHKMESTDPPFDVCCRKCGKPLEIASKDLWKMDDPMRILFIYECDTCDAIHGYFDNGAEYTVKPHLCSECHNAVRAQYLRQKDAITTAFLCQQCGHKDQEVINLDNNWLKKEQADDRQLLAKYRSTYCLSDEEGKRHTQGIASLDRYIAGREEQGRKDADPAYHKAKQLKKLKASEVESLLAKVITGHKYKDLQLDKPQIDRFVIIPFTVVDDDPQRSGHQSQTALQRLFKKALEPTNWRLMSEGLSYRLGYLSGRLKGYEQEEDLMKIIRT